MQRRGTEGEAAQVGAGAEGSAPASCRGNAGKRVRDAELRFKAVSGILVGWSKNLRPCMIWTKYRFLSFMFPLRCWKGAGSGWGAWSPPAAIPAERGRWSIHRHSPPDHGHHRRKPKTSVELISHYFWIFKQDLTVGFFFFLFLFPICADCKKGPARPMRSSLFDTVLISKRFMKGHMAGLEPSWNLVCIRSFSRHKKFRNSSSWEDEVFLRDTWQLSA